MFFETISNGRSSNSDCHNNKHAKEIQELEQVVSDCRRSKKEQETLNNIISRKINQNDVADGVYVASKEEMEILKVAQQKRHAIQKKYLFGDNDTDLTSNKQSMIVDTGGISLNHIASTIGLLYIIMLVQIPNYIFGITVDTGKIGQL